MEKNVSLQFPVPLDEAVHISLQTENIKTIFDFILKSINNSNENIDKIYKINSTFGARLHKLSNEAADNDRTAELERLVKENTNKIEVLEAKELHADLTIQHMKSQIEELTERNAQTRSIDYEYRIKQLDVQVGQLASQESYLSQQQMNLQERVESLEDKSGSEKNGEQNFLPFPDKYKVEIQRLRTDINNINIRLDRKSDDDYNEHKRLEQEFGNVHKQIARLQKQLLKKVNFEDKAPESPGYRGPRTVSIYPQSIDVNAFNDMERRLKLLEENLNAFQHLEKDRILNMSHSVEEITDEIRYHAKLLTGPSTAQLTTKPDTADSQLNPRNLRPKSQESETSIVSRIDHLENKLQFFDNIPGDFGHIRNDDNMHMFEQFAFDIQKQMQKIRKQFIMQLKSLQEQMYKNQQSDALRIHELIQKEIHNLEVAMCNKLADKAKTKRAFRSIDVQLARLIEVLSVVRDGDEAMFSFKPLTGVSCASCAKGLETIKGERAAHNGWDRMPHRDPQSRMSRVGPGFSRMLSSVQPELVSQRSNHIRTESTPHSDAFHVNEFSIRDPTTATSAERGVHDKTVLSTVRSPTMRRPNRSRIRPGSTGRVNI